MRKFEYHINIDERGEFNANVRNAATNNTVCEITQEMFEGGFMSHKNDMENLTEYLKAIGVMRDADTLENMG